MGQILGDSAVTGGDAPGGMMEVLKSLLDELDACVYVSDMETHEILFVNRTMKEAYHLDYDATGLVCWQLLQKGMTGRCSFCPINQLEKDPETPVVWEDVNSVTGRCYKKTDRVIEWADGRKVHMQYAVDITEAKEIQQEADNMLGMLKNILNGMDAYVYVSDMETDEILFINNRMKETFSLDDTPGQICWKVLQDGFTQRCAFCPNYALEKDPATPVVWEEHNTVTKRHYKNVDSVIEWLDGKKVHMQHSTDITDILDAQAETREARERLEIALTASQAGVWVMDLQNDTFSYDGLCGRLMGFGDEAGVFTVGELVNRLAAVMHEDDADALFAALTTRDLYAEWPVRDSKLTLPDGEVRYIRSYANTVRDAGGQTVRVIGMSIDITQSVNMENELKAAKIAAEDEGRAEADARSQVMLDATPLAASLWDADGNILDCNMEAVRLFGLTEKSDYIEHFNALNPEYQPDGQLTREKAAAEMAEAMRTGRRTFDWMYQMLDGEPLPVETTLVRVPWKGEYRLAAYSRDMREIIDIEKERREAIEHGLEMEVQARTALAASEAKSQFLSNMSHEIRTPMNAIIGMAELFAGETLLNDRQHAYINDIKVSATSLLGIINDVLDFSKIESGKLQLVNVDYDIYPMLENLDSMFTYTAQQKGIAFQMMIIDDLPTCLYGDDIRLRQALVNILGNAMKFTKAGSVTFTVCTSGNMLCFYIEDTGSGMKEEDIPHIFKEFDQRDTRKNRSITGTGLGLSITKNLVDMMGGTISVYSEYGKGTLFTVEVPLVEGNPANLREDEVAGEAIYAPGASVLVVDDNELNLNVASGMLRLFGITCDTAGSGAEAIRMVLAKPYDIVFMDHMMPEMDGIEATRRLREEHGQEGLVIVALTANAVAGSRELLLNAKMDDYLAKPIDKAQLNHVLQKWLPASVIAGGAGQGGALPQQEEAGAASAVVRAIGEIDGIDLAQGLSHMGEQEDVYEDCIRIFTRRLPETVEKLEAFLTAGDAKNFAIEVHGLKGSLNNIGAAALGKQAEALELRAKEEDMAFCEANLPELENGVAALYDQLAAVLGESAFDGAAGEGAPLPAGDRAALAEALATARDLLDIFEGDEALEALRPFAGFDYGAEENRRLGEIIRCAEEFEYDRAMELIAKM